MAKIVRYNTVHTKVQLAYLAGIVDGEGCFYIGNIKQGKYGNGLQWHSMLKVTSCDECLILWLEDIFGGSKDSRYRWTSKKKFTRPVFNWQATGDMLDYILPKIIPYLIIKKDHCKIMLQYRETSKNIGSKRLPASVNSKRLELMCALRKLNSRYHDHPLKNPSPLSP
jgi:hypothetical protein